MKKTLTLLSLLMMISLNAQSLEMTAGGGTGAFYFSEEADNSVVTSFNNHQSLYFELTYRRNNTPDALKLRFQQTAVDVEGLEYRTNRPLDGSVETFTTALIYERLKFNRTFNIGYQLGMGITQEELVVNTAVNAAPEQDHFASILVGMVSSTRMNNRLRLNLELTGLWTDPLSTLKGADQWQTAGEDISFILQAGISYRLF